CRGRTWHMYFVYADVVPEDALEKCVGLCRNKGIMPHILCENVTHFIMKISKFYNAPVNDLQYGLDSKGGRFTAFISATGNIRATSKEKTGYFLGTNTIEEAWGYTDIAKWRK
ncbi:MAG: hypothetical protein IJY81_08045, partial [Lachnospiraceae bacterium]|nr:hypothetical protein [Lachnospiraceae bacterium]